MSSEEMDMSARLKAIRTERNLSQKQMGDLMGVSQTTYGSYEAGRTEPGARAIWRLTEIGCDPGWLVTGRAGAGGKMAPISLPSDKSSHEADAVLDAIEEKLQAAESVPFDVAAMSPDQAEMYEALQRIASSAVDDPIRARADLYLRLAWADPNAEVRHKSRETAVFARIRRAGEVIVKAEAAVGWTPPMLVREAMKALVFQYDVSGEDAREALDMIHIAWKQEH